MVVLQELRHMREAVAVLPTGGECGPSNRQQSLERLLDCLFGCPAGLALAPREDSGSAFVVVVTGHVQKFRVG